MTPDTSTRTFDALRPRLYGIAYRMLGTRADAEDVLQDAWLRWQAAGQDELRSPEAWLVTVTSRLAVDRLRSAKAEREAYASEWLPEPIVGWHDETPETLVERARDLSLAFMHMLERLAPEERAAFVLRQAFDYDHGEIARMLGKSEAAVRQIVHRARERLRAERPRFEVPREQHRDVLQRFIQAAGSGDRAAIIAMLSPELRVVGDSGGKVPEVRGGIHTGERMGNLLFAHNRKYGDRVRWQVAQVNGELGLLRYIDGRLEAVHAVHTDGERIVAFYTVRNPDKLAALGGNDSGPLQ
jgi:RNA polymerase sigma-70 factor (ECF subfamily)